MDAVRDENHVPVLLGVSSVDGVTPVPIQVDPVTGRLLVDIPGGGGTVTWGDITGTLSDQSDLQSALDAKIEEDDVRTLTNKDLSSATNTFATASTTQKGPVELSTASEIDTGTDSARAMPVNEFVLSKRNVRRVLYRVLANDVDQSALTTVGGDLVLPFAGTIIEVGATVDTAGVTGLATFDINKNGSTIMSATKITIDSNEKTSRTAATAPVLTTTTVAVGDILTFDIDAIQSTPAKGLTFYIDIRE